MLHIPRSSFTHQLRSTLLHSWSAAPIGPSAYRALLDRTTQLSFDWLNSPNAIGILFALLHEVAIAVPIQLIQGPSEAERDGYANDVTAAITRYCNATGLEILKVEAVSELNDLVVCTLEILFVGEEPRARASEDTRVRVLSSDAEETEKLERLSSCTWHVTMLYTQALVESHMPLFRARWTTSQYLDFIAGFETGLASGVHVAVKLLPAPLLEPIQWEQYYLLGVMDSDGELEPIDDDDDYVPIGPRVPLDAFCQPVSPSNVPPDSTCSICSTAVTTIEIGDEAVVTVCRHHFHAECLGSWVNDSAVRSSNTCPDCRNMLCEARPRVPVEDYESDSDDVEDAFEASLREFHDVGVQTHAGCEPKCSLASLGEREEFL